MTTRREKLLRLCEFDLHKDNGKAIYDDDGKYIRTEYFLSEKRLLPILTALIDENEKLREALEEQKKSNAHTELEINKIKKEIYQNIESCDCEAPCSCKYPDGWISLTDLPYHCAGASIMIDEALAESPLDAILEGEK